MKNWTSKSYKQVARNETIIRIYADKFGTPIPQDKQYWSLCSDCTNDGERHDNTEIGQLLKSGLIQEEQFVGVDMDLSLIDRNKKAYPKATWIGNDFFAAMCEVEEFNPALINFDTISTPKNALPILIDILSIVPPNTMVVCNMVMRCYGTINVDTSEIESIWNSLETVDIEHHPEIMSYSNGKTDMATIVCYT